MSTISVGSNVKSQPKLHLFHFSHKFGSLWKKSSSLNGICQKLFIDIVSAKCWAQGPPTTHPPKAGSGNDLNYKKTISQPNKYSQASLMNSTVT